MPRVPETQSPRVRTQPLRTPSAPQAQPQRQRSEADFGIPALRELSRAGDRLGEIAVREQERQNRIRLMEADRELSAAENEILYNEESGVLTRQGRNAFGAADEAVSTYQERYKAIRESLANDSQRASLDELYQQRLDAVQRQAMRHESSQVDAYENEATEAYLRQSTENASAAYNQPDALDLELERIDQVLTMSGADNGLPPEAVEANVREAQSAALSAAVTRAIENREYATARNLRDQYGDSLTVEAQSQLDRSLAEVEARQAERQISSDIIGNTESLGEALSAADQLEDAAMADAVKDRVRQHYRDREAIRRQSERQNLQRAREALVNSNGDVDAVPDTVWASLTESQREGLRDMAISMSGVGARQTDPVTIYQLERMARTSPDQFADLDIVSEYGSKLELDDMQRMFDLQNEIIGDMPTAADRASNLTNLNLGNDYVELALTEMDIDPEDDPGRARAYLDFVNRQINDLELREGRKPTPAEISEITDNAAIQLVSDRGLFEGGNDRIYRFELAEAERDDYAAEFDDIPQSDRALIERDLESARLLENMTDDQREAAIAQIYTESIVRPESLFLPYSQIPQEEREAIEQTLDRNRPGDWGPADVERMYNRSRMMQLIGEPGEQTRRGGR